MARDAVKQIVLTLRRVESYPEMFQLVNGPEDVKPIYKSGKIARSIGVEGQVFARQVLQQTSAPVMFSHSNVLAVFYCERNVPDSILDMMASNGGILMVTFALDHLFYAAGRIGWDRVGLGSDFEGIASVIPGLEDVRCCPHLLQAILDRGATEDQLAMVAGGNLLRVWRGVEMTRDLARVEAVLPVEDVWEDWTWWRYDGYYQMPDPDPEDRRLGLDWYGLPPP
ncbi:Membrane dipeptidase (Peptidase family M19) [Geosmithia morbida]|uniref:Dipeptidase n=1 Tax=Geosmithia morbida TaxID=1094350 RepID=A0A9P4YT69_9HYPO|nr:Membrane dipeptidase (Peptidase family M19) [Geosmithia morbida]KAF4121211.1 Membrane dipeptidase (Peptidase family M19) [Geosmithia morbida]